MSRTPASNRQGFAPLSRDMAAPESFETRLLRARRLYPPPTTACHACWLQGAEAQIKAARAGSLEAVTPTARDHQHSRASFDGGAAAVRELLGP